MSGIYGGYAVATGANESGERTSSGKVKLRGGGKCDKLPNHWYQGMVTVRWHDHTGRVRATTRCAVPKAKNDQGPGEVNWFSCDDIPVHDQLVGWMHRQIKRNMKSDVFMDIKRRYADGDRMRALTTFAQQVKSGGPWDYKGYLSKRFSGQIYELDPERGAYFFQWGGTKYLLSYEFWSNFHYSYIGRSVGIEAGMLREANHLPGTSRMDAGDDLGVEMGIELHAKYGTAQTMPRIANLLTRHTEQLVKTGVAKPIPE